MSQENVEVVRTAWDHFVATGKPLDEVLAPDFVWDMSTFRGWPEQSCYEGVEGLRAFLRDWFEPFDDLEFEVEGHHDVGDGVVTVIRQHGHAKASGVPVEMRYGAVTFVRGGFLARAKVYADPDEALKAAGLEE